ncbi:MAG: chromate transporter [Chloroflexi bacterium]|nr:chromate transporter [Chloroflexota bacterium]
MPNELTSHLELAIAFLKMGALIFGGGFAIIALIETEVVTGQGWLTHKEFLDGLALGQVTPGPITIMATFVGYKVAGLTGALVATLGIYTPGIALVILTTRYLNRIQNSVWARAFLSGIKPATVGILLAVSLRLAMTMLPEPVGVAFAGISLFILLVFKMEAWVLILAGGLLGLILG